MENLKHAKTLKHVNRTLHILLCFFIITSCGFIGSADIPEEVIDVPVITKPDTTVETDSAGTGAAADTSPAQETNQNTEEETFHNTYTVTIDVDPVTRNISGITKVKYKNKTGAEMSAVYFNLNLNAFRPGVTPKPFFVQSQDKVFENGTDYGGMDIITATVNGAAAEFEAIDTTLKLNMPTALLPNEETEIVLQFEAYIPKISHRAGANDFAIWFGNFLPTLSVYDEFGWHTTSYYPAGDPFYTEIANYAVTINTPPNYTVAATGVEEVTETETVKTTKLNARLVRDFAFAISDKYIKTTVTAASGVEVNLYTYSPDVDTARILDTASRSLDYFSSLISNYPYRQLDIAETGMFISGGMEYPQLIFMDSGYLYTDASLETITHETVHQWFYNIVGNNQVKEAWLDEGLCAMVQESFKYSNDEIENRMAQEYERLKAVLPDIENKGLLSDLSVYGTWSDYYNIQYRRGKLMFYSLSKKMGGEKFNDFLKTYYTKYAYKISGRKEVIATAEEVYGEPLTDFFDGWMQNFELPPL
ncbi:MAG: M1 family metallopeptidase [Clostridiales bacterium]|nr:M1 family metallopeptidase [Clostridiales bacterium]